MGEYFATWWHMSTTSVALLLERMSAKTHSNQRPDVQPNAFTAAAHPCLSTCHISLGIVIYIYSAQFAPGIPWCVSAESPTVSPAGDLQNMLYTSLALVSLDEILGWPTACPCTALLRHPVDPILQSELVC